MNVGQIQKKIRIENGLNACARGYKRLKIQHTFIYSCHSFGRLYKLVLGHVVQNQISFASIVKQASPPPPNNTFNFKAEQIVSLVTNVVLQIAQTQLCTKSLPEKQVQAKSDLSKQIAETANKSLGVNIQGKDVFESIISRPAPPPPAPFVFSSTLAEKKKAPLLKASTILNKVTPQLVTPSTNSTKSTKAPSLGPQRKSSSKLSPPQHNASTKPSPNKPST